MKPSKKILPIVILAAAFLFSIYIFKYSGKQNNPVVAKETPLSAGSFDNNTIETSTSTDWQKTLAVLTKSPNPDEKLPVETKKLTVEKKTGILTETEKLAQSILVQYANLKNSGSAIDQTAQNSLVSDALSDTRIGTTAIIYKVSNLNVSNGNSTAEIKKYGNLLGELLVSDSPKGVEPESAIFARAIKTQNTEELKKLDPIIAGYEQILADLLKLPVPESGVTAHLNLVNSVSLVLTSIKDMKLVFSDPVKTLAAVNKYSTTVSFLAASLKGLSAYFAKNAVTFQQNEYGYVVAHAI